MGAIKQPLNEQLVSILSVLNDGIIITDEKGIVIYINPAYTMFSGIESKDIVGKFISDARPGAVLPQVLETRKAITNVPRKVDKVSSFCDFIPLIVQGDLVGGIVIVKDVVRIKELLHELELSSKKISQLDERIRNTFRAKHSFDSIIGADTGLKQVVETSKRAAQSDSPVLLVGESGVGKEVIAQSIHNESPRRDFPFVDVNCAALPEHLLESELFGYVEGAFTGAKKGGKLGLFEVANGGTLFLDEITEMPLVLQTKMLLVIQEKKIVKLGGESSINLDVKIIAATNKNILELVDNNLFRNDLYFRLAVFMIEIPPLRDRRMDISQFINRFINEQEKKKRKPINISDNALEILREYNWPGNVRELYNAIEYACNMLENNTIEVDNIPHNIISKRLKNSNAYASGRSSLNDIMKC